MFKWLNKQGVASEKGFTVQSVDRFTIQYIENKKIISIYVERGMKQDRSVYVNASLDSFVKWDDGTPISKEKKAEIMENFKEAMEFQEIAVIYE